MDLDFTNGAGLVTTAGEGILGGGRGRTYV
jgi:hypothetical protein